MAQGRRRVIVTFRRKEQRPDKDRDKLAVMQQAITSPVTFLDAGTELRGAARPGVPAEAIGFDINEYEAPIVTASLTDVEVDALRQDGNVAAVEDDLPCYALEGVGAPFLAEQRLVIERQPHLRVETVPAGVAQIKAPAAWDSTRGKVIKVAVLDTGVDGTHPDLAPNYRGGVSFVPTEGSATDHNGHGTHAAGTIAAAITGTGVVGVAPAAYLYGVKVLDRAGSGSFSNVIAGIEWCIANDIKIVSLSLGAPAAPTAMEAICNAAWSKGLLLVAAAGNSGPGANTVGFPARYPTVIAVSAIDSNELIAGFSSRGPEVELCAPGVNVLSTLPRGRYGPMNGTSMACPHVSGAAALAWGGHRYTDNVTIRRLLAWTADRLGRAERTPEYGYGLVDAEQVASELTLPPAIAGIP